MTPQDLSALSIFEPSLLISVLLLTYHYLLSVVTHFFFFPGLLGGSLDLVLFIIVFQLLVHCLATYQFLNKRFRILISEVCTPML